LATSARLSFARAYFRAQGLPVIVVALAAIVVLGNCVTGSLVTLPGLSESLPIERFFPAILAVTAALVPAVDWRGHERSGARSVLGLRAVRYLAGCAVAFGGGASIAGGTFEDAGQQGREVRLSDLAIALFAAVVVVLVLWQRGWWLAGPVLCYAQFYVDDLPWLHVHGAPLAVAVVAVGLLYVGCGPGAVRGGDLLPE
jgi:hypothetical protein